MSHQFYVYDKLMILPIIVLLEVAEVYSFISYYLNNLLTIVIEVIN